MAETTIQDSNHVASKDAEATSFVAFHVPLMWMLLTAGVLLVCFAGPLGTSFVPKEQYAPNSYQWSPDGARDLASTIRSLGYILFAAGLTEHLAIQINKLKGP